MSVNTQKIKDAAIARLTKEKADFESYKGTKMFSKLLGIYAENKKTIKDKCNKSEETQTETPNPEYTFNASISKWGLSFADGIYKEVYETLCSFIMQNEYFAKSILKSSKSFTNCLAYCIHNILDDNAKKSNVTRAYVSDYKIYQRAVEFYFDGSQVKFNMMLINPNGYIPVEITDEDIKAESPAYLEAIETAKQELIAQAKAEAERAEKAKKEKAEREAKEKARKEKEKKKKAREAAKKAQGSILPEVEVEKSPSDEAENHSVTPDEATKGATNKGENPFRFKPDGADSTSKDNIIQLELF